MYFGQLMSQKNMADSERHCNGSVTQRSVCPEWNNVVLLTSELYPCSRNPPLMARIGGAVIGTNIIILVNPQLLLVCFSIFFSARLQFCVIYLYESVILLFRNFYPYIKIHEIRAEEMKFCARFRETKRH